MSETREHYRVNDVVARTVRGVREAYGISESTIYERIGDGTFEIKKAGKRTLIIEASVKAWFEALPDGERR